MKEQKILNGVKKIASYCRVSEERAIKLLESGTVPSLRKVVNKKTRYFAYSGDVDYVSKKLFSKESNNVFAHCSLEVKKEVFPFKNEATIFSINNFKGGVGKTTTSVNLASALSTYGAKVLLVEIDAQSNIGKYFNIDFTNKALTHIVEVFLLENKILHPRDYISSLEFENTNIDVLPASGGLMGKLELIKDSNFLKNVLYRVKNDYDYIIIDTPPSLISSVHQAYVASNFSVIVTILESMPVDGVKNFLDVLDTLNSESIANGDENNVSYAMYCVLNKIAYAKQVDQAIHLENVLEYLKEAEIGEDGVFYIKDSNRFSEASTAFLPIFDMDDKYKKSLEDAESIRSLALKIIEDTTGGDNE